MTSRRGVLVVLALVALAVATAQQADGPKVQLGYPPADPRTDKDVIPVIGNGKTTQVTRVAPAPVATQRPATPSAPVAERDAQAVDDFLVTKGGYKRENVQLVTGAKTTLGATNQALGVWLYRRAGKDDSALVYVAGRGAPEIDASGRERDGLLKYLVTSDTDPESLFSTAFPLAKLADVFQRLRSERVVFLLDADFTGNSGSRRARAA